MKRASILVLAAFIVTAVFAGCASTTGRTAGEIVDDSVITTKINGKIVEDPMLSYLKINVNSTDGNVVLTGFVPSKEAEDRLVKLAQDTKGVKSVKSALTIEQQK